jgi:cobalamin biosynthesis Mg chelatase CobN
VPAVPSSQLSQLVGALNGQFRVASVNYSTVDHSADYVDLTTHLQVARANLDQLRNAPSPGADPVVLVQQVSAAEHEVSTLEGQSATITRAVQLATASIDISEAAPVLATAHASHNGVVQAILSALSSDASAAGWVFGALLAVLPVVLLVLMAWWVRRRWLRRSPA